MEDELLEILKEANSKGASPEQLESIATAFYESTPSKKKESPDFLNSVPDLPDELGGQPKREVLESAYPSQNGISVSTEPQNRAPKGIERTADVQLPDQPDGQTSTVMMSSYGDHKVDGKYAAFPTIFPKDPNNQTSNPEDWIVTENDDQAFYEADKRGEVLYFDTQEEADAVAKGSWKGGKPPPKQELADMVPKGTSGVDRYTLTTPEAIKNQEEKQGFWGNVGVSGLSRFNEYLASVPEGLYSAGGAIGNGIAWAADLPDDHWLRTSSESFKEEYGISNPVLDYYKKETEKKGELILDYQKEYFKSSLIRDKDGNVVRSSPFEAFKNGDIADGFALIGKGALENMPVSLGIMASGGTFGLPKTVAGTTIALFEGQKEEIKRENPEMDPAEVQIRAWFSSFAESALESVTAGTMGQVYKDIIKREGKEVGKEVFRKGLVEMYKNLLKKYGAPIGAITEGLQEYATQVTQNLLANKPAYEGAVDAFLTGTGSGFGMTLPINLSKALEKSAVAKTVMDVDTKKMIGELENKMTAIDAQVNRDLPQEVINDLNEVKGELKAEQQKLIDGQYQKFKALPPAEKKALGELEQELDKLNEDYKKIDKADLDADTKKMLKAKKSKEAEEVYNKRKDIVDKPSKYDRPTEEIPKEVLDAQEVVNAIGPSLSDATEEQRADYNEARKTIRDNGYRSSVGRAIKIKPKEEKTPNTPVTKEVVEEETKEQSYEEEKQEEDAEWASVLNLPINEVEARLNELEQQEKDVAKGLVDYGPYADPQEIKQARTVVRKYQDDVLKQDALKDFKKAMFGNPDTWLPDAILMRESIRAYTEQGGTFNELLQAYDNEYVKDGYVAGEGAEIIKMKLENIAKRGVQKDFIGQEQAPKTNNTQQDETEKTVQSDTGTVRQSLPESRSVDKGTESQGQTKPKSKGKIKPLPKEKTPFSERKIKDKAMSTSLKLEPTDAFDIAKQFFIAGGRMTMDGMKEVIASGNPKAWLTEGKLRISYMGSKKKGGMEFGEIVQSLAESQYAESLGLSDRDIRNALIDVIRENKSPKAMALSMQNKVEGKNETNDAGEKLIETEYGKLTEEDLNELNRNREAWIGTPGTTLDEHIENVDILEGLTEEEIAELADERTASFEDFIKEYDAKGNKIDKKPEIKITFPTKTELRKAKDIEKAVKDNARIKEDYKEVKQLIECLWA